ncbi:MAG: Crp/Fnr family transcriptional regulator [Bacillota bacterium]
MLPESQSVLAQSPLFAGIDQPELHELLNCLRPKTAVYRKNEYIAIAGDEFQGLGIVISGEASVYREDAAGRRVMMAFLNPGDMFGEMMVFVEHPVWPAVVQANTTCMVCFFESQKIVGECGKVCPWHRRLVVNMLKLISERALMLNKKVEYLTIKSIRGKLSTFFLEQQKKAGNSTFLLTMNRNELAEFLGVSRPSMSREMSRMRDEGVIDYHLSSIRILDVEALKRMVE